MEQVISKKEKNSYNIIFCLEVFEYIWNPIQVLGNINNLMKENGILYISFPFIYPIHNPEGKDYLRYTRWGIEKLLKETGFEVIELKSRIMTAGSEFWGHFLKSEAMHLCRGYREHNEIGYCVKAIKK